MNDTPEHKEENPFEEENTESGETSLEEENFEPLLEEDYSLSFPDDAEEAEHDEIDEPKEEEEAAEAAEEPMQEEVVPTAPLEHPTPPPQEKQIAPDDLPLRLCVTMGRKTLSLEEIAAMKPGATMTLDIPGSGIVDIMIEGQKVGQGELVQLGETVGVRVLAWGA